MHTPLMTLPGLFAAQERSNWIADGLNSDAKITLLFVLSSSVVAVIAILAGTAVKIHRRNTEVTLKREMIERGMSADDMERVLAMKGDARA